MNMIRTLIALSPEDKRWLDAYSHTRRMPATEVVREALREYRSRHREASQQSTLTSTAGIWKSPKRGAAGKVDDLRNKWER